MTHYLTTIFCESTAPIDWSLASVSSINGTVIWMRPYWGVHQVALQQFKCLLTFYCPSKWSALFSKAMQTFCYHSEAFDKYAVVLAQFKK